MKYALMFRPFASNAFSVKTKSIFVISLLTVYVLLLVLSASFKSIAVITASTASFLLSEIVLSKTKQNRKLMLFDSIAKGLIAGLLLPETFPLFHVFCMIFFSHLVLDFFSGTFAKNCVHEIAVVLCLSYVLASEFFPQSIPDFEILQMKNASEHLIERGIFPLVHTDSAFTASINNGIFHLFGISIPEGYVSFFWDTHASIPAFRFNALSLFSSIVLFAFDMLSLSIFASFLFSYTLLVRFAPLFFLNNFQGGDMILSLCSSGTLFYAVFVLENAGTIPRTPIGKIAFGLLSGVFAFFIAGSGLSNIGMAFAVLCATLCTPFILEAEERHNLKKTRVLFRMYKKEML